MYIRKKKIKAEKKLNLDFYKLGLSIKLIPIGIKIVIVHLRRNVHTHDRWLFIAYKEFPNNCLLHFHHGPLISFSSWKNAKKKKNLMQCVKFYNVYNIFLIIIFKYGKKYTAYFWAKWIEERKSGKFFCLFFQKIEKKTSPSARSKQSCVLVIICQVV